MGVKSRRLCAARHPDPTATAATCALCRLYVNNPAIRALWQLSKDSPEVERSLPIRAAECRFGTVRLPRDASCWRLTSRVCAKGHGVVKHSGACQGCGDYMVGDGGDGGQE